MLYMALSPSRSCLQFLRHYATSPLSRKVLQCRLCGPGGWKRYVCSLPLSKGSLTWYSRSVSWQTTASKRYLKSATGKGGGKIEDGCRNVLATFSRVSFRYLGSATGNEGDGTADGHEEGLVGGTELSGCSNSSSVESLGHTGMDAAGQVYSDVSGGQKACQSVSETTAPPDADIRSGDSSHIGGSREGDTSISDSSDIGTNFSESRSGSDSSGYKSDTSSSSGSDSSESGSESDSSDTKESDITGPQTDELGISRDQQSNVPGPISRAKAGSINLSDLPRTKDGGILVYPDIHLHGRQVTHSRDKPHPQDIEDLTDEHTATPRKEHDLHSLLYNIQKSHMKQELAEEERRTTAMSVEELVDFLKEGNARDICVIELPPELNYVRYFVICSGMGSRHIGRMADDLQAEVGGSGVGQVCCCACLFFFCCCCCFC